jgi:exonuclease VII large subunit
MAQDEDGTVLRSVHQTGIGQDITVSLSDGTVRAKVTEVKENGYERAE